MMSTAFIDAVMERCPDSQVDLIVRNGFETIPLPHRGEIIPFDKTATSAVRFGKWLRSRSYDRIYILPPSFSSALMAFFAKIPERSGYRGDFRGFLLKPSVRYVQPHRTRHLIAEYLDLLDGKVEPDDYYPRLEVTEDWIDTTLKKRFDRLPEDYVTVAPGVVYGPAKQWPEDYFKRLVSFLRDRDETVIVIGTKNDFDLGQTIKANDDGVTNLCGETSLPELIAVLAKSKLLVSNDSGTMHVMAALQKPQIAVFGSTSIVWTSPMNRKAEVLTLSLDCSPCFDRKCRFGHYRCLTNIFPEMVGEKVLELQAKNGKTRT
ncbi:MAG: lipopolysaccharide heptosyltransferase II [Proteobacteria bacterium]|nr:lipopolysaccharide heptosyltransferase II [Pseudomonadota bacterium]